MNREVLECYREHFGVEFHSDERMDRNQDSAEVWLHAAFLHHPNQVNNSKEADMLFIPFYPKVSWLLRDKVCAKYKSHRKRMAVVSNFLNSSQDFALRGERHLFVCQFWECKSAISLHGMLRDQLRRAVIVIHEHNPRWSVRQPVERELIVPYVANAYLTKRLDLGRTPLSERSVKLFARMSSRYRRGGTLRAKLATFNWTGYNSHVRVANYAARNTNILQPNYTESYGETILRSQFCMHVAGDTPTSRRLFDAMVAGCIPVVLSDDIWPHLPFNSTIPWLSIAIFIPEGDIELKHIHAFDVVWKMPPEEAQKRQDLLLEHREKILYGSGDPWVSRPTFGGVAAEVEHEFRSYLARLAIGTPMVVTNSSN